MRKSSPLRSGGRLCSCRQAPCAHPFFTHVDSVIQKVLNLSSIAKPRTLMENTCNLVMGESRGGLVAAPPKMSPYLSPWSRGGGAGVLGVCRYGPRGYGKYAARGSLPSGALRRWGGHPQWGDLIVVRRFCAGDHVGINAFAIRKPGERTLGTRLGVTGCPWDSDGAAQDRCALLRRSVELRVVP